MGHPPDPPNFAVMMNASYILPSTFISQFTLLDLEKYVRREDRSFTANSLNTLQLPLTSKVMLDNIDRSDQITELLSTSSYELQGKLLCVPCQREFKVQSQKAIRHTHQFLHEYRAAHVRQADNRSKLLESSNHGADMDYGVALSKYRNKERQVKSLAEAEAKCDMEIKQLLQELINNSTKDDIRVSSLAEQEFLLQAQDEELAMEADKLKVIMAETDIINKHLPRQSQVNNNEPQRLSLLPLFDALEVDQEGRWTMINGLRLRFSAAPALHLNWREINHAWSTTAMLLCCLRHAAGLSEVIYLAPVPSATTATTATTTDANNNSSKRSQSVANLRIIPLADRALLILKYPSVEEVQEQELYLEGGVTTQPLIYNQAVLAFALAVAITALELGQQQLRKQKQQSSAPGASGGLAVFLALCGLDRSLPLAELALAAVQGRPLGFDSEVSLLSNTVEADEVSRQLLSSLTTDSRVSDSSKLLQGLQTCRLVCDRLRCATTISYRVLSTTSTTKTAKAEVDNVAHCLVLDTMRLLQQLTV
jgi:hypothetical protein